VSQHKFVDRKIELEIMRKFYGSDKAEFIILYGRRRVGKTELILKFMENKKNVYLLASTEGDRENINIFKSKFAELLNDDYFARIDFKDWFSLFEALCKNVNFISLTKGEKVVIAIDEFPFLIHTNSNIPSIFQRIWELLLKDKNVMLILCGSSVSVMEEKVLDYKSPLYGRRTGQLELQPLSFVYLKSFFANYTMEDLAKVWFVVGGMPAYLLQLSNNISFWENVEENILKKERYLYREAEILLREEFREPKNYK